MTGASLSKRCPRRRPWQNHHALRSAAKTAPLAGEIGAGATLLGGSVRGLAGLGKPASVVPKDYDSNKLSGRVDAED
jgi:hypothetical protein